MNCESLTDRLPEYLDGTLPATEHAAAQQHIEECAVCRQAVVRQKAFAKSVQLTLNREVQGLSLSAKTRQNILDALKQPEPEPATSWKRLASYLTIAWRKPTWAGLAFVCLLLFIFGNRFYLQPARRSAPQAMAHEAGDIYVVDVPIESETHFFRRQNGNVVDTVVKGAGLISANFSGDFRHSLH